MGKSRPIRNHCPKMSGITAFSSILMPGLNGVHLHPCIRRRNIKVFSISAAYTISHGEEKQGGPDLMVSYHDNDHYNSLRGASMKRPPAPHKFMPQQPTPTPDTSELSTRTDRSADETPVSKPSPKRKGRRRKTADRKDDKTDTACPDGDGAADGAADVVGSGSGAGADESGAVPDGGQEPPPTPKTRRKKGGKCPCGSGLSYRKCCKPKDKAAKAHKSGTRRSKRVGALNPDGKDDNAVRPMDGDNENHADENGKDMEVETDNIGRGKRPVMDTDHHETEGNFKILAI